MRILLDTHIALWAIADTDKLSKDVVEMLSDPENEVYYSIVSVWEIAIKHLINPDKMPISEEDFVQFCNSTGFERIGITPENIYALKTLSRSEKEPKHNDPFDRLLLAQAKTEGLAFVTHDSLISGYGEACVVHV